VPLSTGENGTRYPCNASYIFSLETLRSFFAPSETFLPLRLSLQNYSTPHSSGLRVAASARRGIYFRDGEDKNRAAQFCGEPVVRGMALHHRISTLDFLEECPRDCVVAVLSWCEVQLTAALKIQRFLGNATLVISSPRSLMFSEKLPLISRTCPPAWLEARGIQRRPLRAPRYFGTQGDSGRICSLA
jgi:hypothetical protein